MSNDSAPKPLLPIPTSLGRLFGAYFEKASIVYHLLFILLLFYLRFVRDRARTISTALIRLLGCVALYYGLIIFVWGPHIVNRTIWRNLF